MHSLDKKSDHVFFTIPRLHSLCLSFQGNHTSANSDQVLDALRRMRVCAAAASITSAADRFRRRCISISYGAWLRDSSARILLHVAATLGTLVQARLGPAFILAASSLLAPFLGRVIPSGCLEELVVSMRGSFLDPTLKLLPMLDVLDLLVRTIGDARIGRLALVRDSRIGIANVAVARAVS